LKKYFYKTFYKTFFFSSFFFFFSSFFKAEKQSNVYGGHVHVLPQEGRRELLAAHIRHDELSHCGWLTMKEEST